MYIPGETRDNEKVRRVFIDNGGLMIMMIL